MKHYDQEKIGKCISWTGDHYVYTYGPNEVIKFSKFDFFLGCRKAREKSIADYKICKHYFGEYLLETSIAVSQNKKRVALIQPKIAGRFLSTKDLEDSNVARQYKEIINSYHQLIKDRHVSVDLIGGNGVLAGVMSNIFVMSDGRLVLFDAILLTVDDFPIFTRPIFWTLFTFAHFLQKRRIKIFEATMKSA